MATQILLVLIIGVIIGLHLQKTLRDVKIVKDSNGKNRKK